MLQIMTRASTTTDSRHSSTVQVLKVSPTSSPKYSLMSQKPASLTWERRGDAHLLNDRAEDAGSGDDGHSGGAGGHADEGGDQPGEQEDGDGGAFHELADDAADAGVHEHALVATASADDEQDACDQIGRAHV